MRILSIHADRMWYHATRKTKMAEPVDIPEDRMEECVVLFCCVGKPDEKNPGHVIGSARMNVMARLARLNVNRGMIYPGAHLAITLGSPDCALCILKGLEKSLREESISVRRALFGWYEEFGIRGKGHPPADLSMTICPCEGRSVISPARTAAARSGRRMRCMYASSPLNTGACPGKTGILRER